MKYKNIDTRREIKDRARRRFKVFRSKTQDALKLKGFPEVAQARVSAMCGYGAVVEPVLGSDMTARWDAAKALKKLLLANLKQNGSGRRYFFGTLIDDVGTTSDRVPLVKIKILRDKAYRALKTLKLSAVIVVEVHPLMNYPAQGEGRSLCWHSHFIAWTDEPFDRLAATKQLVSSGGWRNGLGAAPAQIQEVPATREDLARVAFYMLKPPHSAKNLMPSKTDPARFRMMDSEKGLRPELALRIIEGLSQIELMEMISGVSEGTSIRQAIRTVVTTKHRQRLKEEVAFDNTFDVWRFWFELRKEFGSKNYLPYRVYGSALMPGPTRIRPAAPRKPRRGANQRILSRRKSGHRHRQRKPLDSPKLS